MNITPYCKVMLKDGRTASVVEVLEPQKAYLVDVDLPGPDWNTIQVTYDDIKYVI